MKRRSHAGVASLVALAVLVVAAPAVAVSMGSGELHGGRLRVEIAALEAGSGALPVDARSPALPRLVHYVATPLPAGGTGTLENVCSASGGPAGPGGIAFGWIYDVVEYARDGTVISDTHTCVPFPDPNNPNVIPPAPALPQAPTIGDVWRSIALPRPVVGANPVTRGVTGLATRLWSGGPETAQVSATVGGFTVTGVARVVEYRFATDEGFLGASAGPGDATSPAATHEFATKGAHTLAVSSVWRATATMTGPGVVVPIPIDLDLAVLTATVDYPVTEVRSVLVG